jgi:hypothetical protein
MSAIGATARSRRIAGHGVTRHRAMPDLGRAFIFLGLLLVVVGVLILGLNRIHLPLGRLPGDFNWRGRGWSVSFPLATSIIVSILLSFLLWIVSRLRR